MPNTTMGLRRRPFSVVRITVLLNAHFLAQICVWNRKSSYFRVIV